MISERLFWRNNLPEQYGQVTKMIQEEKLKGIDAEKRVFKAGHGEIGAYLLSLWGLPEAIVNPIRYHHQPNLINANNFDIISAVYISNIIVNYRKISEMEVNDYPFDMDYLQRINVHNRIEEFIKLFDEVL